MADDKKITQSTPKLTTPISGSEAAETPKTLKPPSTPAPSISTLPASKDKTITKSEIGLPKPKDEPNPIAATKNLEKLAKEQARTVSLSGANAQVLLNLVKELGAKELTPEQIEKFKEILFTRTPEENKQSADEALLEYAIGSDGKFTEEFINFLKDPVVEIPSGSREDIKEKFSFFTLLLLLNQLSSFQRDMAAKSMQIEQLNIEARFDEKVGDIKKKAGLEAGISIFSAILSGVLSFAGAAKGGKDTEVGLKLITSGETIGAIGQNLSKFIGSFFYEAKASEVEKAQSRNTFDQQRHKADMDAASQSQDALLRTTDQLNQDMTIKNIARNI